MTTKSMAAGTAALLMLAGCGGPGGGATNNQTANPANAAAEATNVVAGKDPAADQAAATAANPGTGPSATASSPSSEIRSLLIGRWVEGGDCAGATEIREDGTFTSPAGSGRWTLESEYLTLAGAGPSVELAVQVIDRSAMETVNPMGHIGRWTRC